MAYPSPIADLHARAEAPMLPYGPAASSSPETPDTSSPETPAPRTGPSPALVQIPAGYDEIELEYASLRKHCVLLEGVHRGVLEMTGADRAEFLQRMLTQELKAPKNAPEHALRPWRWVRSFWLNRKGRIDADLRVIALPDRVLLECDVYAAARTEKSLGAYIITEDCALRDATLATHRFSLHGPTSIALLLALRQADVPAPDQPDLASLTEGSLTRVKLAGHEVVVLRDDSAGEIGLELIVPAHGAREVFELLLTAAHSPDEHQHGAPASDDLASRIRLRPAGWFAYNIARLEAGTPLYNIDFGPDSLPAETGVLHSRVSFTKGCYLGQEIVARMHARGHPKHTLVAVRMSRVEVESNADPALKAAAAQALGDAELPTILQPETGSAVFAVNPDGTPGDAIGQVTSSTLAPMLGSSPIALAMVKFQHAKPGPVLVNAESRLVPGEIRPELKFWSR